MMVVLLGAGIGFLLAGLAAIGYGIPINEFGLGNALIIAGTVAASAGMLLIGLWAAVRELKNILSGDTQSAVGAAARNPAKKNAGFLFSGDRRAGEQEGVAEPAPTGSSPPAQDEAAMQDRVADEAPPAPPVEPAPAVKPRRNLLFSSSSRKERERAQTRTSEPSMTDPPPAPVAAPPAPEPGEVPPATFDDAWPKAERARGADAALPRRGGRNPSTFAEAGDSAADRYPPAPPAEQLPAVTVLKSGVVDGMAYSLYSDGSIEAQMPEGMMRFASIDELRAHLDNRP